MAHIGKEALSRHIRSGCDRQLALSIVEDDERVLAGMPFEQKERPGLGRVMRAGREWEDAKTVELINAFGPACVTASRRGKHFDPVPLSATLANASAAVDASQGAWIVQPSFEVTNAFLREVGVTDLTPAAFGRNLRPDLLELCPHGTEGKAVTADGTLSTRDAATDRRIALRAIDIKLAEDPGAAYFGEVTYYSMVLAGWLEEHGLDQHYVVINQGAVWPGSWDAASVAAAAGGGYARARAALEDDLEITPFEALVPAVRRFLLEAVPRAIETPWTELDYHVSSACASCPFIGTSWGRLRPGEPPKTHPLHCINLASSEGHLSQVPEVTRGARTALRRERVQTLAELAAKRDDDAVFDGHHVLKSRRSLLAKRAEVLHTHATADVARKTGSCSEMPRWADLHVHATAHFDITSALTLAMGISAFAPALRKEAPPNLREPSFATRVWHTDAKDLMEEWDKCLKPFLEALHDLTRWAVKVKRAASMQLYLWDELERKHILRIVSRHLSRIMADRQLRDVAWMLFPSEEVLPNPATVHPSPITVVRNVVQQRIAVDVPHHYTLLRVAREVADRSRVANPAQMFWVPPFCQDLLTDQIPSERAHDIWSRPVMANRGAVVGDVHRTVRTRLRALDEVRHCMHDSLNGRRLLSTEAPAIAKSAPRIKNGAMSSQLWFLYAQLNSALDELEAAEIRAMPTHEREARHHSVRLLPELTGHQRNAALTRLFPGGAPVGARIFGIREGSKEAKVRPGDFAFSVTPETEDAFLERKLGAVARERGINIPGDADVRLVSMPMRQAVGVKVLAFDREAKEVALQIDSFWGRVWGWPSLISDLERGGVLDFSRSLVLDPVAKEFLLKKLGSALSAFGNPPEAVRAEQQASGLLKAVQRKARVSPRSCDLPGVEFLWDAANMHASSAGRATHAAEAFLNTRGMSLNDSQLAAWRDSMNRRLSIIWGPPGTGKTHTLKTILAGIVHDSYTTGRRVRIGVGATTYKAINEVLDGLRGHFAELFPQAPISVRMARSQTADAPPDNVDYDDCVIERDNPQAAIELFADLIAGTDIEVVGITSQQISNLIERGGGPNGHPSDTPHAELFDVMILDEASQTDVANAVLFATGLAGGASVIVAGDPLQLAPIHPAEPPAGLESWVGALIDYLRDCQGVPQNTLLLNYRSNRHIVELGHAGNYPAGLAANSPNLRLRLQSSSVAPPWRSPLAWAPEWDEILDPSRPVVCLTYDDTQASSQWNHFEAQIVASLVLRLRGRLLKGLANELDYVGGPKHPPTPDALFDDQEFFEQAIGIVTPHRAQLSLIGGLLERNIGHLRLNGPPLQPEWIRGSVDTVERFQGQERDVIIVSYALGDTDAVANEEEFLLSLNRFNVAASRARAKLIVLVSDQVVHHLPTELEVLRTSALLKVFATTYCDQHRQLTLPAPDGTMPVRMRWRS